DYPDGQRVGQRAPSPGGLNQSTACMVNGWAWSVLSAQTRPGSPLHPLASGSGQDVYFAPSTIFLFPSGVLSFTSVVFSMPIMMQVWCLALGEVPAYRVRVTRCLVSCTLTRWRTVQGSTPDHQVRRILRPLEMGVALVKGTLRGLSASPVGLTGLGLASGG